MRIYVTILLYSITLLPLAAQQQILLIGTQHQTQENKLVEILPVREAILDFKPEIICVEYRKPTDTESLKYLYGQRHFIKQDSLRKAWNIPTKSDNQRLGVLMPALKVKEDLVLRMELRNLFYVRSDFGNSDYQTYLIMEQLKKDSSGIAAFRKRFPMYDAMKSRYVKRSQTHDEYNFLVFPVANRLGILYLNPTDDQTTNNMYEKYFEKLSHRDTLYEDRRGYHARIDAFFARMGTLPPETNTWVYANSPEMIEELTYVEGYKLDPSVTSPEVKMLSYYWTLRNKKMAMHIRDVAQRNPGKKIVVFFGASHVGPIREELARLSKNFTILTLYDLNN